MSLVYQSKRPQRAAGVKFNDCNYFWNGTNQQKHLTGKETREKKTGKSSIGVSPNHFSAGESFRSVCRTLSDNLDILIGGQKMMPSPERIKELRTQRRFSHQVWAKHNIVNNFSSQTTSVYWLLWHLTSIGRDRSRRHSPISIKIGIVIKNAPQHYSIFVGIVDPSGDLAHACILPTTFKNS